MRIIVCFCVFLMISCSLLKETKEKNVVVMDVVLIKSIPGGDRAHVVTLNKEGVLVYYIGNTSNIGNKIIDVSMVKKNKIIKERKIKKTDYLKVNNLIRSVDLIKYSDTNVFKDAFEYHLYIDSHKKVFIYKDFTKWKNESFEKLLAFLEKKIGYYRKIEGTS